MNFDAAFRENRRGYVLVALDMFLAAQTAPLLDRALELLKERMMVVERRPGPCGICHEWHGYSADFASLPLGAAAPRYGATFTCGEDGSLALAFERAG